MKSKHFINLLLQGSIALSLLVSCDSTIAFTSSPSGSTKQDVQQLRANVLTASSGKVVQVTQPELLPENIKKANEVAVLVDNSNTKYLATKNADGTFSFPLSTSTQIQSDGTLTVIMIGDNKYSQKIDLYTGSLLKLSSTAISVTPSQNIIKGTKLALKLNFEADQKQENIDFNWFFGATAAGPWTTISGNKAENTWDTPLVGSFYLRVDMVNKITQATSSYVTPNPLIFVKDSDSDDIVTKEPASGNLTRGESITLTASLPETQDITYDWFYGASKAGPFYAISGNDKTIKWIPTVTGDFFLRIKTYNKTADLSKTYTTSTAVVSVKDSDALFEISPNPASLKKGESVKLTLKNAEADNAANIAWSYTTSPASGVFLPIPASGKTVSWTPAAAGSFYVRAETTRTGNSAVSSFTSATALVVVSESTNVITTQPVPASVDLGAEVRVIANVPNSTASKYNWSYGVTSAGPWIPVETIQDSVSQKELRWIPPLSGSFYLKVDVTDSTSQSVITYTSPTALVFVNEYRSFFVLNPSPARVITTSPVQIETRFTAPSGFIYAWSYGPSTAGPWIGIGGTTVPKITWDKPKATGTYYIKFDAISLFNNKAISFISKTPLVFVDPSNSTSTPTFGQ